MSSARADLAVGTRSAHLRLHRHRWISQLASPTLTMETYSGLIAGYHLFFRHVEEIRRKSGVYPELSMREAIDALKTDQDAFATSPVRPVNDVPLIFSTTSEILGALYVLHGSRFGAQVLAKNIMTILPAAPVAYFLSSPSKTQWRNLLSSLETNGKSETERYRLIAAANLTFDAFGRHITACMAGFDGVSTG